MSDSVVLIPVSQWLSALDTPGGSVRRMLDAIYGTAPLDDRLALLRRALQGFAEAFGDAPVMVVRAPGRLNLRGMHVDTHGGYLNLVTHQREIVVVAAPSADGVSRWRNDRNEHAPFELDLRGIDPHQCESAWVDYIGTANVRARVDAHQGSWAAYIEGALLRAARASESSPAEVALNAYVASDLPEGAAVSSSAALCLAVFLAACGARGFEPTPAEQILATRDAEWYTGARTGTSDPAAMVLGATGELVHVALLAEKFSIAHAERLVWPADDVVVLTVHSHTQRRLAGAELLAYTTNRFAYSVALEVFRQEMQGLGFADIRVEMIDRLAHIQPDFFGGIRTLAGILSRVPEISSIEALRARYNLPDLDALVTRYFGTHEPPEVIGVRGPLVFGIAESHRARLFRQRLADRDFPGLGALMTAGHNGDRVRTPGGTQPYDRSVSLAAVAHLADESILLENLPGDYGASSPVLDALVDAALEAGSLGASLTGAGIAGSVIALAREDEAEAVMQALRATLSSERYARTAGWPSALDADTAEKSVEVNHITAPAGILPLSV